MPMRESEKIEIYREKIHTKGGLIGGSVVGVVAHADRNGGTEGV